MKEANARVIARAVKAVAEGVARTRISVFCENAAGAAAHEEATSEAIQILVDALKRV